jgi:membrane-bound inhibitor of C-type lysozyme
MGSMRIRFIVVALVLLTGSAVAEDSKQKFVSYRCDAEGRKLGLPRDSFVVKYAAGGGSSVAILPVQKRSVTLTRIAAGSGAKYVDGTLIWWEKGDSGTVVSKGKESGSCWVVPDGPAGWAYPPPPPAYP